MKKIFYLANISNLLFGLILFVNTYLIYEVSVNNVLLFIGVILFEVAMFFKYLIKSGDVAKEEYIVSSLYFIFMIFYLIFMLSYQSTNSGSLNIVYFSKILFIPHFLYAIFISY